MEKGNIVDAISNFKYITLSYKYLFFEIKSMKWMNGINMSLLVLDSTYVWKSSYFLEF